MIGSGADGTQERSSIDRSGVAAMREQRIGWEFEANLPAALPEFDIEVDAVIWIPPIAEKAR